VSYVTNDFAKAIERLHDAYGWKGFQDLGVASLTTVTGESVRTHIGLGYFEPGFVELHHPESDPVNVYVQTLKGSLFQVRWHHVAFAVQSPSYLEDLKRALIKRGLSIPVEGGGEAPFIYVDTRAELGHYTEYFALTPMVRELFQRVQAAAAAE